MKLNRQTFLQILKATAPAIDNDNRLPSLRYICFRNGNAMTTNLQLTIITPFAGIEGLLPHKLLLSLLSVSNAEEIELTEKESSWVLKCDSAVHKLGKSEDIKNYPVQPVFEVENSIIIDSEIVSSLKDAIKFSGVITSGAEGCYIGKDIVGTNGTFVYKHSFGSECKLHVPSNFITLLPDAGGELQYSNKFVSFKIGDTQIITNQLEAKYPSYEVVFKPDYNWNVTLKKADLEAEIKSIMAYSPDLPIARFEFSNDITVTYINADLEQQYDHSFVAKCYYEGYVRLNLIQLSTVLSCFTDDEIEMCITSHDKSVYLREKDNQNTIILIQPVL